MRKTSLLALGILALLALSCLSFAEISSIEAPPAGALTAAPAGVRASAKLVVSPYVQNVSTKSATIIWQTDVAVFGEIKVSSGKNETRRRLDHAATFGEIKINGLSPGTDYKYSLTLGASPKPAATGTFRTFPSNPSSVRFLVYGDTRTHPDKHAQVIQAMASERDALFALHTGNVVEDGRNLELWPKEFFTPANPLIRRVPVFVVLGNHERNSPNYFHYFSLPGNERWYSFTVGQVHIIALDSNTDFDAGSEQYKWLIEDLAVNKAAKWKFVFLHHPVYGSGNHDAVDELGVPKEKPIAVARRLFPDLAATFGIQAVFSGHDHLYERSTRDGVQYIIAGGGGAPLYGEPNAKSNPYRKVFNPTIHYCVVDISGDSGQIVAKTPDGKIIDKMDIKAR